MFRDLLKKDALNKNNTKNNVFNGNFIICSVSQMEIGGSGLYNFMGSGYDGLKVTHKFRIDLNNSDIEFIHGIDKDIDLVSRGLLDETRIERIEKTLRLKSRLRSRSTEVSLYVKMLGYKGDINLNTVQNTINVLKNTTDFLKSDNGHNIKQHVVIVSGVFKSEMIINNNDLMVFRMSIFDFITCRGFFNMLNRKVFVEYKLKDRNKIKDIKFLDFLYADSEDESVNDYDSNVKSRFVINDYFGIKLNMFTDELFHIIKKDINNFVFLFEDMDRPLINVLFTVFLNTQINGGSSNRRHVYNGVDDVLGMFLKLNSNMKFNVRDIVKSRMDNSVLNNLIVVRDKNFLPVDKYSWNNLKSIIDNSVYLFNGKNNLSIIPKKNKNTRSPEGAPTNKLDIIPNNVHGHGQGLKCGDMDTNVLEYLDFNNLNIYNKSKNIHDILFFGLKLIELVRELDYLYVEIGFEVGNSLYTSSNLDVNLDYIRDVDASYILNFVDENFKLIELFIRLKQKTDDLNRLNSKYYKNWVYKAIMFSKFNNNGILLNKNDFINEFDFFINFLVSFNNIRLSWVWKHDTNSIVSEFDYNDENITNRFNKASLIVDILLDKGLKFSLSPNNMGTSDYYIELE